VGTNVVGGGGGITPLSAAGQARISAIGSQPALTSVSVFAAEDETGFGGNWSVRAYAICAPPLPGLVLVHTDSPGSSSNKSVTAPCPAGKQVVGTGGGLAASASRDVVIERIRPEPDLSGVTVAAAEDQTGYGPSWLVGADAICATP
jgi:hypothetical protein